MTCSIRTTAPLPGLPAGKGISLMMTSGCLMGFHALASKRSNGAEAGGTEVIFRRSSVWYRPAIRRIVTCISNEEDR
jgi:hypothetical protein